MTCAALLPLAPPASAAPKYADIVVDAASGKVLRATDADSLRYPASLTKMMTLYLVFEALESGRIRLNTAIPVSAHAASEPPSKLGLRPGSSIMVEQVILGLVTRSANDASTAIGEYLGGSEARFAQMMTAKARALGMSRTTYRNANGLPNPGQMTTARDQARLGIALRKHFPQYYRYFSTRQFAFGRQIIGNHNRLLGNVRGVDGIKTGFTNASGFNLVTSVQADGRSLVGVVLGGSTGRWRDNRMRELVTTYLPKASGRGGSDMIASVDSTPAPVASTSRSVAAAPRLPVAPPGPTSAVMKTPVPGANVPVPGGRYEPASSADTAFAPDDSDADGEDGANAAFSNQPAVAPAARTPRATQKHILKLPDERSEDVAPQSAGGKRGKGHPVPPAAVDRTVTSSTKAPSGWVVQIGVSDSRGGAMDLLDKAKSRGGKALRSAQAYAMAFGDGGKEQYRARFIGFNNQKSAVNACNVLKKSGISCWAALQ